MDWIMFVFAYSICVFSFFTAMYMTFQLVGKMYVHLFVQMYEVIHNKTYQVSISNSFVIGIPILWTVFLVSLLYIFKN
jgi:hypothetical protein